MPVTAPLLALKKVVGIKTETVQGTAVALSTTDFHNIYDFDAKIKPELLDRPYASASLDPYAHIVGKISQEVKFKTDLKGNGNPISPIPPLSAILQACGLSETIGASTTVYAPLSSAPSTNYLGPGKSCTIKGYEDGMLKVLASVMFNAKFIFEVGKIPIIDLDGKGLYAAITDAAFPTNAPDTTDPPVCKAMTFTLHGASLVINKCEIDLGNTIAEVDDVTATQGLRGFIITDRKPKGSCDPEARLVATHDFYGRMAAGTVGALSIVVGSGSGKTWTFAFPSTQYGEIGEGNRDAIRIFNVPLIFSRNTGDDFMTLTLS